MSKPGLPVSRGKSGRFCFERLFGAGARLTSFFVVLFNPPNDGDAALRDALERYRDRVVVAANIDVANANQIIVPNVTLIHGAGDRGQSRGLSLISGRTARWNNSWDLLHSIRARIGRATRLSQR